MSMTIPSDFDVAAAQLHAVDIEKAAQETAKSNQPAALQQGIDVLIAMSQLRESISPI